VILRAGLLVEPVLLAVVLFVVVAIWWSAPLGVLPLIRILVLSALR
jgi:hypothetical protein